MGNESETFSSSSCRAGPCAGQCHWCFTRKLTQEIMWTWTDHRTLPSNLNTPMCLPQKRSVRCAHAAPSRQRTTLRVEKWCSVRVWAGGAKARYVHCLLELRSFWLVTSTKS